MIQAGDKFGFLTAVRFVETNRSSGRKWLFACVCGKEHITRVRSAQSGKCTSCGCRGNTKGRCTKCNTDKPLSEFYVRKNGTPWTYCKDCNNAYRAQRVADPEENKKIKSASIKCRSQPKTYINLMLHRLRRGAIKRNIPFNISKSDIQTLAEKQKWKCLKTGIHLDLSVGSGWKPFGPSIDRIDNSRGYEADNIQLVCAIYNLAKNQFGDNDVLTFAHALVEHQQQRSVA